MKKKHKPTIDFSKKVQNVFPKLWIDEKLSEKEKEEGENPSSLEIESNWITWENLKKNKGKLCLSLYGQ